MINWSAFNTTKHEVESTAWGGMTSSSNLENPMTRKIDIEYVPKNLPVFSTVVPQHGELNNYLKHVILERVLVKKITYVNLITKEYIDVLLTVRSCDRYI